MNEPRKLKGLFEILLVIGVILLIPLFFAIRSQAAPTLGVTETASAGASSSAAVSPTTIPSTKASFPTRAKQPSACTFPLATTTTVQSKPQEYTFSEPQVVLKADLQPDIVDWLPDNQNVIIMPLKLIDLGVNGYQQTIETFNPETKETHTYAIRRLIHDAPPVWNPTLNAIIYPATNVIGVDKTNNQLIFTRQVRISYGDPDKTQLLADNLPQYSVVLKSDGSQTAYLLDKQIFKLDPTLKVHSSISFDRMQQDYRHATTGNVTVDYKMAWRPNSAHIFLYNWAYDNLGYTEILDADTGRLCNLEFGGWALVTRWSPNGRYLAIVRAQGSIPLQSTDLAVLDTATGKICTLQVPQEIQGRHLFNDIAWAPDNQHLAMIGSTSDYSGMLFIGDFLSGQVDRILSGYKFQTGWQGVNLAWSPDGSKLLLNCPVSEDVKQVCLSSVQINGK